MLVVIASYIMGTSEYQTHLEEDIKKEEANTYQLLLQLLQKSSEMGKNKRNRSRLTYAQDLMVKESVKDQ
jgi:hypothetical protein